ncbi:hypothetical protein [Emcibacter sp. SYSU 3D8]|uniref:hypothetical protein n=1 Tax=Emcibacter sp. SYSU 3D8 TaxID=3133969 RepID=UPI0031FE581B
MSLPAHLAPVVFGMVATMRPLGWADRLAFIAWRRNTYENFRLCFGTTEGLEGFPPFGVVLEDVLEALGWPRIDCFDAAALYGLVEDQHLRMAAWQWATGAGYVEALHGFTSAPDAYLAQRKHDAAERVSSTVH